MGDKCTCLVAEVSKGYFVMHYDLNCSRHNKNYDGDVTLERVEKWKNKPFPTQTIRKPALNPIMLLPFLIFIIIRWFIIYG